MGLSLKHTLLIAATLSILAPAGARGTSIQSVATCARDRLRETFLGAAVAEASGLIKSPWKLYRFRASDGLEYPELAPFFGPKTKPEVIEISAPQVGATLSNIDSALRADGFPELKLQNERNYDRWMSARDRVIEKLPPGAQLSDYVAFSSDHQTLFYRASIKGGKLVPVVVRGEGIEIQKNKAFPSSSNRLLDEEDDIRNFTSKNSGDASSRVRLMSPVTNDMHYARDSTFELEGDMIARLRSNGARTVPRVQELLRVLAATSVSVSPEGRVSIAPEVLQPLRESYEMAFPESKGNFDQEIQRYAERRVYHELADRYLEAHPDMVNRFVHSEEFATYAPDFIDRHLSYIGATEQDVARGMLAGNSLYQFEKSHQGVTSPEKSYSQRYLASSVANSDGYMSKVENWIKHDSASVPSDIPSLVKANAGAQPFPEVVEITPALKQAVSNAAGDVSKVKGQLDRHDTHSFLTKIAGKFGLTIDTRRSFSNNIIANFGLAKAEGVYTVSAFFDSARADGYLGPAVAGYKALPRFEAATRVPTQDEIVKVMQDILQSPSFEDQNKKIAEHAPILTSYFMNNPEVPANVRKFAGTLYSDKFAQTVYQKLGKTNDPNTFNRFFPDGSQDFENMNRYRYLFDLVHGTTTALVKSKGSHLQFFERVLAGKWRKYDFPATSQDVSAALKTSLQAGSGRLAKLEGDPSQSHTIVDTRDKLEVWFGWDTYDMKFLRNADHWDEWSAMGGGWNCICFTRKTLFNPFTLRQF